MVHLHGGHFSHGASNLFPGHMLAAWGEVVVVTLNYRLGALGYLSTGDDQSPGNYGLLDQAMALRWIHENIHYFNGDRSRVTVFGDDAGAASAGLLAVSPRTSQLVHRVIAQAEMTRRHLRPGETADVYLAALQQLAELMGGLPERAIAIVFVNGLPETVQASVQDIQAVHESVGHQGVRRTWWYARRELGSGAVTKSAVRAVVKSCQVCASIDPAPSRWKHGTLEVDRTWERLAMDVTHFRGKTYLTVIDCGPSRYAMWREIRRSDGSEIVGQLESIFLERGAPAELLMDNATEFKGRELKAFAARWDVNLRYRAAYEPGGNGIIERHHRTIKVMATRQGCTVPEAVHRYNVTPKDGCDIASAPVHGSGSPLADWGALSDPERARNTSRVFAERIGCLADTSSKLVNCLMRGRSALEIGDVDFMPDVGMFPWAPVVQSNISLPPTDWYRGWTQQDWRVLPDHPERLYRERAFSSELRLLTGANRDEAAGFIYTNSSLGPEFDIDQRWVDERIHEWVLQNNYTLNVRGVETAVRHLYTYWPDPLNRTWTRHMFVNAEGLPLSMKTQFGHHIFGHQRGLRTRIQQGTNLFGLAVTAEDGDRHHLQQCRDIIGFQRRCSDYALTAGPSADPLAARFLSINNTFNSTMHSNYRQTETAFWSSYLPTLTARELVTYRPITEFWWDKPSEPLHIAFWTVTALAFLLLLVVAVFCFLWQNNKRKHERFYEETFLDGNMGVKENAHFASSISKPPSLATVQDNDISTATNQTEL
ncbi:Neuroligin-2 [Amphibalanus amphitrite]|uniref:Neuroligin-2 n=1 Tax=Amphibalanus amphitrite TaxID=1232801 RepID=A0A6A4VC98_AMPAM|nr:Neuroligin-2 [Amphibalanus amphitrite]